MLDKPTPAAAITAWTLQPLAVALVVLLAAGYAYGLRHSSYRVPRWRIAVFALGLLLLVWSSCGFGQVYGRSLYWVWLSQTLMLWLAVPIIVLLGHPVQLAQGLSGPDGWLTRVLRSRFVRLIDNPLVGPALVPVLSFALFFGPLPEWTARSDGVDWGLQIVLVLIGALMVLPLAGLDEEASSLAVGLSLAIGAFELVLDAVPGIVLRLYNSLVSDWFVYRAQWPWSPHPLRDQKLAGNILWTVAEVIDVPFLVLVFRRWLRADARDAAEVDAVLEAERAARIAIEPDAPDVDRDAPWWITDPRFQDRFPHSG